MPRAQTWRARRTQWMHRVHARLAARARPATGFVSQPEPRTIGHYARGRQLLAGNFLFAGHLIEAPGSNPWEITPPDAAYAEALHGFAWLDDLAAVGDLKARMAATPWLIDWIARYGRGTGPGWTPDLTGRRLIRWINHALFVLRGQDRETAQVFYRSLAQQTIFLSKRWTTARVGLPRFEALTGMIYAGLSLTGMDRHVAPAVRALDADCATQIDAEGGIRTRNPEELLEVFTLLTWAAQALSEAGAQPGTGHMDAIERIAPTLRTLRHADGGLARFHGGGRGLDGRLDHALASAGVKSRPERRLYMGYARLSAGRTTVIADAAPPPAGPLSVDAHASTCAFELTSGRRPVVVNCGSGVHFGEEWRRAGRATPSHSTLCVEGYSSSRLAAPGRGRTADEQWLADIPTTTPWELSAVADGTRLEMAHDGYQRTHGLTHARTLELTLDGRGIAGEDLITTLSTGDETRFDRALDQSKLQGVPFTIRFHLHPEVDASIDLGGAAVSLALKSGEIWVFRKDGEAVLTVEPSVYLESGRLRPRASHQVVLSGRAMAYATRVRWSLAKAQETPNALRDLVRDDEAGAEEY